MKLPDGPKTPPFLQLLRWIGDPLGFIDASAKEYGDIFTLRIAGFPPFVLVGNPQGIQEIFTASPGQFDTGAANGILRWMLGDNSVILLDGDRHRRQRQLLMPPFHGERMRAYGQLICQLSEKMASEWAIGESFLARNAMQEITMQVILQAVFGLREGERYQQLKHLLGELLDATDSPLRSSILFLKFLQQDLGAWSPWGKMMQRLRRIDELLFAEIRDRREQADSSRSDILSLLMSARDDRGEPMADVELRDELMTLLVAGHETTATALSWALYWIHQLPDVRDKLLQELDALGDNPDPMAISRLPYLTAVCQETLRIYPVLFITLPRVPKSLVQVMGHEFAPDAWLVPCIHLTHRREDLYPEPERFKPERFLERQFSPYEYLPFGGGNRTCIGMALALFEMKLVLATMLSRVDLALAEKRPVRAARRGLTLAPASGVRMAVTQKRESASRSRVLV